MVASLAITAVLLAVLSQFLFSAAGLWGKNDRAYRGQHQFKLIYQTVYSDLSAAYAGGYLPVAALAGEPTGLRFWKETPSGLQQVSYRFDPSQAKVFRSTGFWGGSAPETELFREIVAWQWEYYQPSTRNWLPEWRPGIGPGLPALIRLSVRTKTRNLGNMIIPLQASEATQDGDS
jgi:hypothetical protein